MVHPQPAPIKVYGMAAATCTRRVLMVLEEKGVPYELVTVDLSKGDQLKPEYLAMQPFAKIPVIVDGDLTMFESRAIARYISKKYADQGTNLLGKTLEQQALVDNWVEVESGYYNGPIGAIVMEKVFKAWRGAPADEAVVAEKLVELNKVLDVYEAKLSKTEYIAGNEFSLADIVNMSYMDYLVNVAKITEPLDKHPKVKAWWDKISARPTWKKATGN